MQTMAFDGPQTEPAFLRHEKFYKSRQSGAQKGLANCCYSISNLVLIIACVIAIVFTVKFFNDDPLYEYGEHLLTERFYRQIIFIICILPLVLLLPLFNAASAFFLSGRAKHDLGASLLTVKMLYQIIVTVLVFVALAFIAPSIRFSSVANQVAYELRRHMKRRYDNDFSYEFLDRIQEEYECCDELWYRANYFDKLPLTCFLPDGVFNTIYERNCADVIGSQVSNRCMIIAACLVAILVALGTLIAIDVIEMVVFSRRQYDVGAREARIAAAESSSLSGQQTRRGSAGGAIDTSLPDDYLVDEISNRLKLSEREREAPLLPRTRSQQSLDSSDYEHGRSSNNRGDQLEDDPYNSNASGTGGRLTPILTKASYIPPNRPQSPFFVQGVASREASGQTGSSSPNGSAAPALPPKGVLKKTSSFQRIDSTEDQDDDECEIQDYHRQMQRDLQTRRSLLNVRFAD